MFRIEPRSSKPIYEQIIDNIRENVVKGFLNAGDELPSVRKMAVQLAVTPNTVAKAYRELEREKVIEVIRGKGTYISSGYKPKRNRERIKEITQELTTNMVELAYMGLSKAEVLAMIEQIFDGVKKEEKDVTD